MSIFGQALKSTRKSLAGNPKLSTREIQMRVLLRKGCLVDGRTIRGMRVQFYL